MGEEVHAIYDLAAKILEAYNSGRMDQVTNTTVTTVGMAAPPAESFVPVFAYFDDGQQGQQGGQQGGNQQRSNRVFCQFEIALNWNEAYGRRRRREVDPEAFAGTLKKSIETVAKNGDGSVVSTDLEVSLDDISEPVVTTSVATYDDPCLSNLDTTAVTKPRQAVRAARQYKRCALDAFNVSF